MSESALRTLVRMIPSGSGAIVMGTGIVSISLAFDGEEKLSRVLLVLASIFWLGLAGVVAIRFFYDRQRLLDETRSPLGLTSVAASAVLGSRLLLLGLRAEAEILLTIAVGTWIVLMAVLASGQRLPTTGGAFMLTVAPESLSVLAASLASSDHKRWLLDAALAAALIGLALYPLALDRFDLRQLRHEGGEQWVAGGALAISTLALSELALAAVHLRSLRALLAVLHTGGVVVWVASVLWLPVLLASELFRPRVGFSASRWSTVFPVGMYAACSFELARSHAISAIKAFAEVWTWVAVAVWLIVLAGSVRAGVGRRRVSVDALQVVLHRLRPGKRADRL